MIPFISVHITTSSRAEAENIARALVREKLVACVNIMPDIRSFYMWKGKLAEENEVLLIAKTRTALFEPLSKFVQTLHSYDCPGIVALPIADGYRPYLDWINQETKS